MLSHVAGVAGIAGVVGTTDVVAGLVADRVEFHSCTEIEIENADEFEEVYVEVSNELSGPLIVYYSLDEFVEMIDGTTTVVTHEVYPHSEIYHTVDSIYLSEDGESPPFDDAVEENRYENPLSPEECLELKDWEPSSASVVFRDQKSDGTTIVIDEIELSHGGFVALHDEDGNPREDPPRTASSYLDPGTHSDVAVELPDPLLVDRPLVAAPYHDLTDNRAFDAAGDEPYLDVGEATWEIPSDDAFVTIERDGPFEVVRVDANDPVEAGEVLEVTVELENAEDTEVARQVHLLVEEEAERVDTATVTLGPGQSQPVVLRWESQHVEQDVAVPVVVKTDDDAIHRTVEVFVTDGGAAERIRPPGRELTVQPGTEVMFEVGAVHAGERQRTEWHLDGERAGASHGPWYAEYFDHYDADYWRHTFESGSRVTVEVGPAIEDRTYTMTWDVDVAPDGVESSSVTDTRPPTDEALELVADEPVELELDVAHPDGELDRVVWWLGHADVVLGESELSGREDTASLIFDSECPHCGIHAWVIGEEGTITTERVWVVDDE